VFRCVCGVCVCERERERERARARERVLETVPLLLGNSIKTVP
jgi:hypothetical protein